jgi:hypothetical protein
MVAIRALRWLSSSVWLRVGAIQLVFIAALQWVVYAASSVWLDLKGFWLFLLLFYLALAVLELWLATDSAEAVTAPLAARLNKSRIWRHLNKPNPGPIANSVTLTVIVIAVICAAILAAMIAVIVALDAGFSHRVIAAILSAWPIFACVAGYGALWRIFYHAGVDPSRAIDKLFLWAGIGAVGFFAGMIWVAYPDFGFESKRAAQRDFHRAMLSASAPCVTVQEKLSDLSACMIFGLRPGMAQSEVLGIVNGSGYFRREKPETCSTADKCSHYVTFSKDGLYLRVEFRTDPKSSAPAPEEQVSSIVFALDERANPYFDEAQMMEKFLKLLGPNGFSIDATHMVWTDIRNDLELRTYTYEQKFWLVFSRLGDRRIPLGSGVPV